MLGTNYEILKFNSKKYGKIIAFYNKNIDKLKNGYIIRAIKKGKMLSGYIDLNKNLIIDFEEMAFLNYISANHGKDLCLAFRVPNGLNIYYHLKQKNKKYYIAMVSNIENPVIITCYDNVDKYWLISTISKNPSFVLYNYDTAKVTTTYLDYIELVEDHDVHKFYYEKQLYGSYDDEEIYATTLCGFLDKNCMTSSNIYDKESGKIAYDANLYRNTLDKSFTNLCVAMIRKYLDKYIEKEELDDEIIAGLYDNPAVIEDKNVETKVYQFKGKNV